jgi:hypothetical protein
MDLIDSDIISLYRLEVKVFIEYIFQRFFIEFLVIFNFLMFNLKF